VNHFPLSLPLWSLPGSVEPKKRLKRVDHKIPLWSVSQLCFIPDVFVSQSKLLLLACRYERPMNPPCSVFLCLADGHGLIVWCLLCLPSRWNSLLYLTGIACSSEGGICQRAFVLCLFSFFSLMRLRYLPFPPLMVYLVSISTIVRLSCLLYRIRSYDVKKLLT